MVCHNLEELISNGPYEIQKLSKSVEGFSGVSVFLEDLLAVNGVSLRNALAYHGDEVLFVVFTELRPDDVLVEEHVLDLGEHGDLVELVP